MPSIMRFSYVYMMTNRPRGTLYVGVTSDLIKRVWEHCNDSVEGFTKKYGLKLLVWYEQHKDIAEAILREKQIKKWKRLWKIELIEKDNPEWIDLYPIINGHMDSRFRENDGSQA